MRLTTEQVVNIIRSINPLNIETTNNDKLMDVYFKSFDIVLKHDNAADQMEKAKKVVLNKYNTLLNDTKDKTKKGELVLQCQKDLEAIPAVKHYEKICAEEVDIDLPTFTEEELRNLSKKMSTYAQITPLLVLREKADKRS